MKQYTRRLSAFLLGALLLLAAATPRAEDWPCWLGPDRDGISRETGLLKEWPADGPPLLWEAEIGAGYSCVAVAGNRAVTQFQTEKGQWAAAYDVETGRRVWLVRTGDPEKYWRYPGPRSTPTIEEKRVYVVDGEANFVCINLETGIEIWRTNTLELFGGKNLTWGTATSPLLDGDLLIVNTGYADGASVAAFDKKTGKPVWKNLTGLGGHSSPTVAEIDGVRQYVFFLHKGPFGLSEDGSKVLWQFPWSTEYDIHAMTPIVRGNRVFFSSGYGSGASLLEIDLEAPEPVSVVWQSKEMQCRFDTPVLHDGHLYGFHGPDSKLLRCIEFDTGAVKWSQPGFEQGAHVMADGMLYVVGNGCLALARPTPEKFDRVSIVPAIMQPRNWTPPTVANGRLYLRDEERIKCLEVKAKP